MLHVLLSVRGYKTVVRFFPHEAADLERVLQVTDKLLSDAARTRHAEYMTSSHKAAVVSWMNAGGV
jgi:hypothetical protein